MRAASAPDVSSPDLHPRSSEQMALPPSTIATTEVTDPTRDDLLRLRSWISGSRDLPLISDREDPALSSRTLDEWLDIGRPAVLRLGSAAPIAFATLSTIEAPLPPAYMEICHFIVHPQFRRHYFGSQLILSLASTAQHMGCRSVVGRVVPTNAVASHFLKSLRWNVVPPSETWASSSFLWYRKTLS